MSDTNFSKVRNVAILSPWDVRVYSNVIIFISGMCTHMRPTVHSVFASNVRCCSPCDSVPDWCMFLINFLYIISFNRRFFWSESFNLNLQVRRWKDLKQNKDILEASLVPWHMKEPPCLSASLLVQVCGQILPFLCLPLLTLLSFVERFNDVQRYSMIFKRESNHVRSTAPGLLTWFGGRFNPGWSHYDLSGCLRLSLNVLRVQIRWLENSCANWQATP